MDAGKSPPRNGPVVILKSEDDSRPYTASPVTLSPRKDLVVGQHTGHTPHTPHTRPINKRDVNMPIGILGGQPVFVLSPEKQEVENLTPYSSPVHCNSTQDTGDCYIDIVEQPEEKFRFRYKSEMQGTHGCIHGRTYSKKNKKFPTIQVRNVPPEVSTIRVRVALYTTGESFHNHHVHKVMWKQYNDLEQDFLESDTDRSKNFRQSWQGLGIIHTSRKFIDETLNSRITKLFLEMKGAKENNPNPQLTDAEELQLKADARKFGQKVTNKLNTVVLGFEAFWVDNGIYRPLCVMAFSNPINNLKNPSTGELKICRISAFAGSVNGDEEVFIFIERVKKGDIHVRFFELDQDEERVWEELAEFQEGDVHHQYAIAFKTPKYRDTSVTADVGVFFELYRPSDGAVSDPKAFRYKPLDNTRMRKRAKVSPTQAMRSLPLPVEADTNVVVIDAMDVTSPEEPPASLNNPSILNNLIENLLREPDYTECLTEPSPYEHLQPTLTADIVPDLLVFNRLGMVQEKIASDSGGAVDTGHQPHSQDSSLLHSLSLSVPSITNTENMTKFAQKVRETLEDASNSEGSTVLHRAVLDTRVEDVRQIVSLATKHGCEDLLEQCNKAGSTPLHLAVQCASQDIVRLLLQAGVNPNKLDQDGETAVHLAVREGSVALLHTLLHFQADPNIPSHRGKFPLHIAVEHNLLHIVRLMEEQGADMEAGDQVAGRTALHLAVDRQLEDMVRYLVKEAKVDLSREDYSGNTATYFAETCKNQTILKIVNKGPNKKQK